jgi:alginate O-acetyltransferase complex protein AlgI
MKKEYSNILLLVASLIFYAWGEPTFVLVMITSILINWRVGLLIAGSEGSRRKLILALGVICDLAILGYFKYAAFFASIVNGIAGNELLPVIDVALPIGISFFTFQAISYIADVYRGETDASQKLVNTALYIAFFPQLIAGPIVKYRDINRQIESRSITTDGVSNGFKRFIYGLAKKVLISNVLGLCVDSIYAYDVSLIPSSAAWIGALAYTFQIYYDFSGYSDMAIGLGKMFGFDILENFNYPYLSRSISEFWRRWHISLGSWFREYVYFPLGGNRKGRIRTYLNLAIVFVLTGLWHGAALSFVMWGCYHGFFMIAERLGLKKWLDRSKIISTIYCFTVVNFGWVLFRAPSTMFGIRYILRMLVFWRSPDFHLLSGNYVDYKTIFIGACALLGAGAIKALVPKRIADKWRGSVPEALYCVCLLILCLASLANDTYNPFIYFQF